MSKKQLYNIIEKGRGVFYDQNITLDQAAAQAMRLVYEDKTTPWATRDEKIRQLAKTDSYEEIRDMLDCFDLTLWPIVKKD